MAMCMARVDTTIERSHLGSSVMIPSTKARVLLWVPGFLSFPSWAQDSSAFKLGGYAEVYYAYDLARPDNGERPDFLYNHKRHNEFTANFLLLSGRYDGNAVRGSVGLMAGTYVQYNLAAEPDMLRNVYEARIGLRLAKERDVWLDVGILPSHIGFEGVIGSDQMTLTRSLVAENSPYYEAGAMLSYRPDARWLFAALVLNGWQRIQREPGNQRPAFGTQVQFDNGSGTLLNWSSFVGSMGPDSSGTWRLYNNFYAKVEGDDHGMELCADVGVQEAAENAVDDSGVTGWLALVGIYQQRISGRWWGSGRIEYFLDDQYVASTVGAVLGASLGVDVRINEHAMWRFEGRLLGSAEEQFQRSGGGMGPTNTAFTTAFCLRF